MKNSKKVIIISFDGKWSHREQKRFKVEYLLSKEIKVRILSDQVEVDFENLQLTKKEFPDFIKNSKNNDLDLFLLHTSPNFPKLLSIFMLTLFKIRYAILVNNPIPETVKSSQIRNFLKNLYLRLLFIFLRRPHFFFYGGKSLEETLMYKYAVNKVSIHSHDYESFISDSSILSLNDSKELKKEYIVFIDEGGNYHPDQYVVKDYSGFKNGYYEDLKQFLKRVSKITNKDVYIALHPSVDESKLNFGDLKVFKNITRELIKCSDFVLMHKSTSIGFATLYKKNVIILDSEFCERAYRKHLYKLADFFDTKPLQMNKNNLKDINYKKYFCNQDRYKDYIKEYLSPNLYSAKHSWIDTLLDYVL